jgi:hypothetical protein
MFVASLLPTGGSFAEPKREVVGLAPDGFRSAQLVTRGRRPVPVAIRHNVFFRKDNVLASPQRITLIR